jgi:hypothetical protein
MIVWLLARRSLVERGHTRYWSHDAQRTCTQVTQRNVYHVQEIAVLEFGYVVLCDRNQFDKAVQKDFVCQIHAGPTGLLIDPPELLKGDCYGRTIDTDED